MMASFSGNQIDVAGPGGSGTITLSGPVLVTDGLDVGFCYCNYQTDRLYYIVGTGGTIEIKSRCGYSGTITLTGVSAMGGKDAGINGGFWDIVGEGGTIRLESTTGTGFIVLSPGCQ
jgi:hypothetical protein